MSETSVTTKVVDGDGHILEDLAAIRSYMPSPYREVTEGRDLYLMFPPLDHLHSGQIVQTPPLRDRRAPVALDGWRTFLDDVGIEHTVVYPTWGLAFGHIESLDYAVVLARAYNDWLYNAYLAKDARFKGMALIPMQDPEEAVKELRRAVEELGMLGAMIPSNGLPLLLGSKPFWPVYAEAERLACCLAVHGGAHDGFGMNHMNMYVPVHALGHPWGLAINMASILYNGVFDRFPRVRFAFLEGGVAWLLLCLERLHASHETHFQYVPEGSYGLGPDQMPDEVIIRHIREGRIYVGCETEELTLAFAISEVGNEPFFYSSDYPHEVTAESCKSDIEALVKSDRLESGDKEAILYRNSERLYGL